MEEIIKISKDNVKKSIPKSLLFEYTQLGWKQENGQSMPEKHSVKNKEYKYKIKEDLL